ncbi:hypothetical protein KIH87_12995 [Paraneptunicella aestuarii]|uniref:hypothetical protein n=1 Tax=Paraneptunicella aestuarii TaxID=2831148 RepID=UPI001E3C4ADB|nr:hypothetical protein [Paraneptunicella aestuarii]UAA37625.1 hypothetical protein KIH87_12995 [Paraneptunicella aestuarii]
MASFDISDDWVISLDVGSQEDDVQVNNNLHASSNNDSWGAGLSYYWENWVFTYNYSNWQDELVIIGVPPDGSRPPMTVYRQTNDSPTHAFRAGYYWQGADWQLGVSTGIHFNEWEQFTQFNNPQDPRPPQDALDEGETTFVSISANGAKFFSLNNSHDLVIGSSISWNELTNDDANAVVRNGRPVNQIPNRNAINRLNSSVVSGSESYGQANLYASWSMTSNWMLDISLGSDFGDSDSSQFWSLNIGYVF